MPASRPAAQTAPARDVAGTRTETQAGPSAPFTLPSGTLRLRAQRSESARHIQWAEDVVDNEGMGKKSSKVCCIYHKPREAGESSDESSDESSSDDDSGNDDDGAARPTGGVRGRQTPAHRHDHDHDGEGCGGGYGGAAKAKGEARKPSPNAYEKMPKHTQK